MEDAGEGYKWQGIAVRELQEIGSPLRAPAVRDSKRLPFLGEATPFMSKQHAGA